MKYSCMDVVVDPSTVAMLLTLQVEWHLFDNRVQQHPIICFFPISRTAIKWIFLLLLKPVPKHYLELFSALVIWIKIIGIQQADCRTLSLWLL